MMRFVLAICCAAFCTPVVAEAGKEETCQRTGELMGAVQQARLDRVSERKATEHILAENPTWPARYGQALPLMVEQVYGMKRRDVRNNDLAALAEQQCLQQWDLIEAQKKNLQTN